MQVQAYVHGLYPRSEALVAATRDLERGRTTEEAVERQRAEDLSALVSLQQEAGLDLVSDGLTKWQDIFRVLVDASDGLGVGALVRWFDNNSFFRAPVMSGSPAFDPASAALVGEGAPSPLVGTLPSPYMFSRAGDANGGGNALMMTLASDVLRPAAEELVSRGARLIHLEEPWLVYFGIEDSDWETFRSSVDGIRRDLGVPVILHTYYGDASPYLDRLRDLPVDAVGIDFVETDWRALAGNWQVGLVAGCVNGRATVLESPEASVELLRRVADAVDPPALYVCPNCELELVPEASARNKVLLLGDVAGRAKEALS